MSPGTCIAQLRLLIAARARDRAPRRRVAARFVGDARASAAAADRRREPAQPAARGAAHGAPGSRGAAGASRPHDRRGARSRRPRCAEHAVPAGQPAAHRGQRSVDHGRRGRSGRCRERRSTSCSAPRYDVVHPPDPIVIDLAGARQGGQAAADPQRARVLSQRARDRGGPAPARTSRSSTTAAARITASDLALDRDVRAVRKHARCASARSSRSRSTRRIGLGERHYTTWVQYTPKPNAELDGSAATRSSMAASSCRRGVAVTQAGRYKVIALALRAVTTAIAFAQNAIELDAGAQRSRSRSSARSCTTASSTGRTRCASRWCSRSFPTRASTGRASPSTTRTRRARIARPTSRPSRTSRRRRPSPRSPRSRPSQQGKPPPLFTR